VNGILINLGLERHFNSPALLTIHRYGVSAGIQGSMQDLGGEMFWDLTVIMHELGHNFGSHHTHDADTYNPQIDACGGNQCTSLVTGNSIKIGEGTIMSYCHLCGGKSTVCQLMHYLTLLSSHGLLFTPYTGGTRNIGMTFGGHWNGNERSDINNWSSECIQRSVLQHIPMECSLPCCGNYQQTMMG
jgi:hypothetical protein